MRHYPDDNEELAEVFSNVMERYFPLHQKWLNFQYVWRDGEKLDDEGLPIIASVKKLANIDRDVHALDIRVEVDSQRWEESTKREQIEIAYHEMLHVKPEFNEQIPESELVNAEPERDKEGRVKFVIEGHDLVIKKFKAELKAFGLTDAENSVRELLNEVKEEQERGEITPPILDEPNNIVIKSNAPLQISDTTKKKKVRIVIKKKKDAEAQAA